MASEEYDVVIIGGGHNGLVAAAYLARAGKSVVVLEKHDVVGGAAISARSFEGVDARLSRYSYLVSLLPQRIIDELGLDVRLAPRRFGSYTPSPDGSGGLLIDETDAEATRSSFESIGAAEDAAAWTEFYGKTEQIAKALFDTVLEPLRTESEVKVAIGPELWRDFIETPIGDTIESTFQSDLVRGVVMTDALIGTFASNHDDSLQANVCFLYHVIGNGTGEWNIPVGGMGAVTGSMAQRASELGADLRPGCEVTAIGEPHLSPVDGRTIRTVSFLQGGERRTVSARHILANVAQPVLEKLLGNDLSHSIEGSQVKVNMVLSRLPRLKADIDPSAAFGGTFHINEGFEQLQSAYEQASRGEVPDPLPCEIYCHSLTDSSILDRELRDAGAQTLTVFALHTPHSLVSANNNDAMRATFQDAVIASLNSVLAEDIRTLILTDTNGNPCIETKTTLDLERALGLPGGNIFHRPLQWPFVPDGTTLDTPEARWGVESGHLGIFYCGSTARRGGAVSGIGGHNAAMAVLG